MNTDSTQQTSEKKKNKVSVKKRKRSRPNRLHVFRRTIPDFELQDYTWSKTYKVFSKNVYVEITSATKKYKAHLLKKSFDPESLEVLAASLAGCRLFWEYKEDLRRGPKDFLITGRWNAQGHCNPHKHKDYAAGRAGKMEEKSNSDRLRNLLGPTAVRASWLLRKYRPELAHLLEYLGGGPFGLFHLFMCPVGTALLHRDPNDLVSFLFLLRASFGCKGGLELGGLGVVLKWEVGDGVILDSRAFSHGTRDYQGVVGSRYVGLFIVHRTYLYLQGVEKSKVWSLGLLEGKEVVPEVEVEPGVEEVEDEVATAVCSRDYLKVEIGLGGGRVERARNRARRQEERLKKLEEEELEVFIKGLLLAEEEQNRLMEVEGGLTAVNDGKEDWEPTCEVARNFSGWEEVLEESVEGGSCFFGSGEGDKE
jgi:hypothetical protein